MALKSFDELRKVDISEFLEDRDGADYLNWAKCCDLLHENGAKEVWFTPVVNPVTHSSLFMTDEVFTDKSGNTNRCYEVEVLVHIDSLEFNFRHPVTNGANPVKDNSLTQSRVWTAQTRAFVKGVAIHTGLGFDLWLKGEKKEQASANEIDVVELQDPEKLFEKLGQFATSLMQKYGLSEEEIGVECGIESNLGAVVKQKCRELKAIENALKKIDSNGKKK